MVAIDFGTTFSGYAYSFTHDPENIHIMRKWEGKITLTIISIDSSNRYLRFFMNFLTKKIRLYFFVCRQNNRSDWLKKIRFVIYSLILFKKDNP